MGSTRERRERADIGYQGKFSGAKGLTGGKVLAIVAVALAALTVVLSLRVLSLQKGRGQEQKQLARTQQQLEALQQEIQQSLGAQGLDKTGSGGLEYQQKYEDMYVEAPTEFVQPAEKTVFLTFDDGPSKVTPQVLDALDAAGAKGTFFVVGTSIAGREDMLRRMVEGGHAVAIHTFSHEYRNIYASVDAFLDDFYQVFCAIRDVTGVAPTMFRFPGGSVNGYNKMVYQQIIAEMCRRGFVYYDWNVDSGDASGNNVPSSELTQRVMGQVRSDYSVVLMHDAGAKQTTAQALPGILQKLKEQGYVCQALTPTVNPPQFAYSS